MLRNSITQLFILRNLILLKWSLAPYDLVDYVALVAEWLRVRLRVRMVKGSTLTVGNFLSLENLNVIIRAIN